MLALYATTLFTSAALLFLVQPMFARFVLPLLGGSPAVWNTAMVFFQAVLLAGYAYAHASTTRLGVRRQAVWHLALLVVPLAFLPIALPAGWAPPVSGDPSLWLLGLMAVAVGFPFFAVSTTSPVLQKWFATTGHRQAADPYFLYAAGNVGSMLALLSYPAWVEPHFRLAQQSRGWMWGYWLLVALTAGCAAYLWKTPAPVAPTATPAPTAAADRPTAQRRGRWVLLAFAPSSLLLGVTNYLSSDIAAVPLLWVVPLAIYLGTVALAFARRQIFAPRLLARAFPILLVALVLVLNLRATQPIAWLLLLHLAGFFVAALLCHAELAADRPATTHLTEFYLWMSVGGVLGGIFNALLAPLLFNSIVEYPLALLLACLVGLPPAAALPAVPRWRDGFWPALLGLGTVGLLLLVQASRFNTDPATAGLLFGAPAIACYFFSRRPLRFTLGLAILLFVGSFYLGEAGHVLRAERSFFGVHRVTRDPTGGYHLLVHGKTLHGMQSLDPARRHEALTYYHRTGPIGQVLALYGRDAHKRIAVVGLGAGSLASYALPGQAWTYFEIDPVVLKLARDARYFTFLRDSPADLRVVLGDARRSLAASDRQFDLLILDAYSSDTIPLHLVTREALALYLQRLAPGGLLAFHISNLHLDLEPVFANLARDAYLACLTRDDTYVSPEESQLGKSPSVWLVMARRADELAKLAADSRWQPSRVDSRLPVWTDDYSSLLSVFRWQ
jgi:SAM-dependent methyltransferase